MIKALLLSPRPDFSVPAVVCACPRGVYALAGTTLYAALDGKYVTGPLTPFLVDLLVEESPPEAIAARHGEGPAALEAVVSHLRALGLRA